MREIKFRAKRIDNGEMIEGYYGIKGQGTDLEKHFIMISELQINTTLPFFYFNDIEVIPESVGQFTGLTDKNGKEIYEGDILLTSGKLKSAIVFYEAGFYLECHRYNGDLWYMPLNYGMLQNKEIIGNIYENPELIK